MKKSDLKNGRVAEVRNGDLYIVIEDFMAGEFDYELLSRYDDNLLHDINSDYDIVKVYEHKNDLCDNNAATIRMLFNREHLTLLCEREEHNLTEHEIEILEALQRLDYEWLSRDKNGELFAYVDKPHKLNTIWRSAFSDELTRINKHLFTFIKWADTEPTKIKELLEWIKS